MAQKMTPGYPRTASFVALFGGIIITLGGVMFLAASAFILPSLSYVNLNVPSNLPVSAIPGLVAGFVGLMGAFGLVSGAVGLASSMILLSGSGQPRTWSILSVVLSLRSFFGMGGFVLGAVFGIVGGVLARRWNPMKV